MTQIHVGKPLELWRKREERLLHDMLLEAEANDAQVLRVLKWSGP